jgi:hypothetical protein
MRLTINVRRRGSEGHPVMRCINGVHFELPAP